MRKNLKVRKEPNKKMLKLVVNSIMQRTLRQHSYEKLDIKKSTLRASQLYS